MKNLLYILVFVPLALFGQDNYSLNFDYIDDYVLVEGNPTLDIDTISNVITISTFFKANEIALSQLAGRMEESGPDGYRINLRNNGDIWAQNGSYGAGETAIAYNAYSVGEWIYITAIFKNHEYIKLYINGVLEDSVSTNRSFGAFDSNLTIGRSSLNWNVIQYNYELFSGYMDRLEQWNTELSVNEIQQYINCPPTGNEEGLVGYWNFNEGSGDTVYDISGNGNHGIINGATYSDDVPEQNCDDSSLNEPSIIDQLNQSFDAWNVSIDLSAGWNMFGYGCPTSINVAEGLSNHTESIIITKDNNGNVYMPEFGFNGIGDFTPGFGYQIKLTEAIEGFSLCDWYVNDIPEDNIVSLQDENASLQAFVDSVNSMGCIDSLACNFDESHLYEDGSCEYPEQGYDCDGNIDVQVGDEVFGGIVFYVNETSQRGIVVSELITNGASDPYNNGFNGFEWGCHQEYTEGADNEILGSGKYNTISIQNNGCTSENGGIIAAEAALNYEINNFSDWYLPSINELILIESSIANTGIQQDIDISNNNWYWSSTQYNEDHHYAEFVNFLNSSSDHNLKYSIGRVRAVNYFGNWIEGCIDSLACNFNPEANMADGSCEFPEQGYDCNGNITAEIGDIMEGGYLFYLDESGERGLVAALEDLEGTYQWSCFGTDINGADLTHIGSGMQNTSDILNYGCTWNTSYHPGSVHETFAYLNAAQGVIEFETEEYFDWFLPSHEELLAIRSLCYENTEFASTFDAYWYYSSSEQDDYDALIVQFPQGEDYDTEKWGTDGRVRPIRSFGNWTMGCMDETACNYNPEANMADGSCTYAEQHFDCDGNLIAEIEEPLCGYLPTNTDIWPFVDITIPDGYTVHSVYADFDRPPYPDASLDFSIAYCSNCDSFPAFIDNLFDFYIWDYETIFYSLYDSEIVISEVSEIELKGPGTIRVLAPLSDDGWNDFCINFQLIYGCMDSLACNYNPDANVADGSCSYPEEGYDCDGNIDVQVGDVAFGGIVFYVDETGQHGLVASMEDLPGTYQWGCYQQFVEGADATSIGSGYQNTLDIVSGCIETPIAASQALAYESEVYSDWYLPSIDELKEMYDMIGQGASIGNVGNFLPDWYSSSSDYVNTSHNTAWGVYFNTSEFYDVNRTHPSNVRPIRSF